MQRPAADIAADALERLWAMRGHVCELILRYSSALAVECVRQAWPTPRAYQRRCASGCQSTKAKAKSRLASAGVTVRPNVLTIAMSWPVSASLPAESQVTIRMSFF